MKSSRIDFIRFASLSAVVVGLTAAAVAVAERLGAPGRALGMAAVGITLGVAVAAGLASGTMRLPAFLTQGRDAAGGGREPGDGGGLALGVPGAVAGRGRGAGCCWPPSCSAPAPRRSGAPTWASFVGTAVRQPPRPGAGRRGGSARDRSGSGRRRWPQPRASSRACSGWALRRPPRSWRPWSGA